jgi:hypothetical protein
MRCFVCVFIWACLLPLVNTVFGASNLPRVAPYAYWVFVDCFAPSFFALGLAQLFAFLIEHCCGLFRNPSRVAPSKIERLFVNKRGVFDSRQFIFRTHPQFVVVECYFARNRGQKGTLVRRNPRMFIYFLARWFWVATKVQQWLLTTLLQRGTTLSKGIGQQTNNMVLVVASMFFAAISTCLRVIQRAIGFVCLFSELLPSGTLKFHPILNWTCLGGAGLIDRERLVYL